MRSTSSSFQPILLGSDFNVYGMARSIHEEYKINSIVLCSKLLAPTKFSSIISVHILDQLDSEEQFVSQLQLFFKRKLHNEKKYLLIPCGDKYAKLLSKYQNELKNNYIFSSISFDMFDKLINKSTFYKICEDFSIPYPKTVRVSVNDLPTIASISQTLPFSYPVILKPSDSVLYQQTQFEEKKKAYILANPSELLGAIHRIYSTNYQSILLIQEYIPGSDANMRVLNAYVDHNHNVRMMSLGNPILEDPSPENIGNYVAILPDFEPVIFENIRRLLTKINYQGFANFDLKYDPRDSQYKIFEINLRQGRSSYFATLNGANLAKFIVDDLILSKPFTKTFYPKGDKLWLGAPPTIVLNYLTDTQLKRRVKSYLLSGKFGTTSLYKKDRSIRHHILQLYTFSRYKQKFNYHFKKEFKE